MIYIVAIEGPRWKILYHVVCSIEGVMCKQHT